MRLRNEVTGDILEVPPPDELGTSVVRFNGRVVETVLYSDVTNTATLGDGRVFGASGEFADYLVEQLRIGAWR